MNPDGANVSLVRLSTDAFPPDRRLAMWREIYDSTLANFYGRATGSFDIEPLNDEPFRAGVTMRSLPGLGIACGYRSDARYHRPRELMALSSDNLIFHVVTNGIGIFSQCGREGIIGAGEALLMSATEPYTNTLRSGGRMLTLSVPRGAISPMVVDVGSMLVRPIPRHVEALRLLLGYLAVLHKESELLASALQRMVVSHIHYLVASTLGLTRDATEADRVGGVRAARLATIRADVLANLSNPRLSAKTVGPRHGVSDRYVHRLFAETGQTFGDFVGEQRLKRAFELLTTPSRIRKIGEIAAEVGFTEHSSFNRAFRRHFGDTPSGVRRNRADKRSAPD